MHLINIVLLPVLIVCVQATGPNPHVARPNPHYSKSTPYATETTPDATETTPPITETTPPATGTTPPATGTTPHATETTSLGNTRIPKTILRDTVLIWLRNLIGKKYYQITHKQINRNSFRNSVYEFPNRWFTVESFDALVDNEICRGITVKYPTDYQHSLIKPPYPEDRILILNKGSCSW
uniref:Uncharacterized protein n=1 Tax=Cacopsylla melanoneura TaxID=428564 RepID=A0A8D8XF26_9HEMI